VAVVTAPDRLLLVAVEPSEGALLSKLGEYVRANAPHKLLAADAMEAVRHLDLGEPNRAVELYFSSVGRRWDREFLHRQLVGSHQNSHARV